MYLKKLEIQGFKSFADRLQLEFKPGITSVVGPNGSGKSNIADAVRWVLGEQSVKMLRGSKMEDVIFTGTQHRKPLGLAEVSITIDNADGALPVEYSEVTVSRRIYRSGESEYLINKVQCRLKDIYQLFIDTGIGRDGYSIIGQGRINEILSNKSEDRRLIFEEASGIMKYKIRKIEAEKKLEQTSQNLLRINDILNELESQLEPLKIQSETARAYLALKERLKELEINVYIDNITKYKEKIAEYTRQCEITISSISEEKVRIDALSEKSKEKEKASDDTDVKLEESRKNYYLLNEELEKLQSAMDLNMEKIRNLSSNASRLEDEINETNRKAAALNLEKAEKISKMEYLSGIHTKYTEKLIECEKKTEELMLLLSENERFIESLKSELLDKMDIISDKKMQINNCKTHIQLVVKRNQSLEKEIDDIKLETDRENLKKEEMQDKLSVAKRRYEELKAEIEKLSDQSRQITVLLAEARNKQSKVKSELQISVSRQKILKEMESNFEGYSRSVKAILKSYCGSDPASAGIHGALAGIINVQKEYAAAIETALGGALQNIVTSNEYDAKKAIEYLKQNKSGRATFLPLTSVRGKMFEPVLRNELKSFKGYRNIASELVETGTEYVSLIQNLLGRVAVVEDIDCAIRMARKYSYTFKIVTLNGEVINPGGSIAGGSMDERISGLLNRGREIDELTASINAMAAQEKQFEKEALSLTNEVNGIIMKIDGFKKQLHETEIETVRCEGSVSQQVEAVKKLQAKADMLRQEAARNIEQKDRTESELALYEGETAQIELEIVSLKERIADNQEKHQEDRNTRESLYNELTDYKISVSSIKENMDGVQADIDRIEKERAAIDSSIGRKKTGINDNNVEIERIGVENQGILSKMKSCEEEKLGKNLETDRLAEEKKVLEDELKDISEEIQKRNEDMIVLRDEQGREEVRKIKAETEMEQLQNRMWDEYALTYNNAMQYRKEIGSMAKAQKDISALKAEIESLGVVNVSAIDDYVKVKERYTFMKAQGEDMEASMEKLRSIIDEMVSIMRKQFIEQFGMINENFGDVFKELFGGGSAELILADEGKVLESDIEIKVQPPGKKLQNMMLLSGGEKAFTAIALLFGILKLKPTPFCVLDEIEAALDDANVYRFGEYLRKYCNRTQFVMITHKKGTMEMSDTLYGITMQERGVSSVISIEMTQ